jgi:hypothetical protein
MDPDAAFASPDLGPLLEPPKELLRGAGTNVALLWVCFGAQRHPDFDSISLKLLDDGRVAGVVAAHVPVRST